MTNKDPISVIVAFPKSPHLQMKPCKEIYKLKFYKDMKFICFCLEQLKVVILINNLMKCVHSKIDLKVTKVCTIWERGVFTKKSVQNIFASFTKYMVISNNDRAVFTEVSRKEGAVWLTSTVGLPLDINFLLHEVSPLLAQDIVETNERLPNTSAILLTFPFSREFIHNTGIASLP